MKQFYREHGWRDNPFYPPYHCMTLTRCEKCGEMFEASDEHICRKKNSYPWDMEAQNDDRL